jgi:hypothetical protein
MARRLTPLLIALCLVLGSPLLGSPSAGAGKAAQRAPLRTETAASRDLMGRVWQRLTVLWAAAGCGLDPDGARCAASSGGTLVAQPPAGCGLDPNGCR